MKTREKKRKKEKRETKDRRNKHANLIKQNSDFLQIIIKQSRARARDQSNRENKISVDLKIVCLFFN